MLKYFRNARHFLLRPLEFPVHADERISFPAR